MALQSLLPASKAGWCWWIFGRRGAAPCRAELPNVIATYKKHHADGFEIIGVSLDSERDKLDAFLKKEEGMTWPQFLTVRAGK